MATVTIPELIAESGFDRVSVLKIDIEGAETELFGCEPAPWLNLVDSLVIELHGQEASEAFFCAIEPRRFDISRCGEPTDCLTPLG